MVLLKLHGRYLNLEHVVVVEVDGDGLEIVTPFEVLRLAGADAGKVLRVLEALARQAERRLELAADG
jgi:hypothetical protein